MNRDQIIATAQFLGDEMTEEQATRLMDQARLLSIADLEYIYLCADLPSAIYTELSMYDGEMGGLGRY